MATIKQKKAFEKILENTGNVSKSMNQVGYAPSTAKNPKELTDSKGFKELCEEYGLTDDLLIRALVEDIQTKAGNRKGEVELGFKVKGRMVDKVEHSGEIKRTVTDEELDAIIERAESRKTS